MTQINELKFIIYFYRIIHQTGKILAHSGKHKDDAEMMTVITNNIWMLYSNLGSIGLKEDPLNTVMLNFAVIVMFNAFLLLCLMFVFVV